jgi:Flp pilus assembly pilin Flp
VENNIESGKEIIMSISNLGAIGYQPQVTSFTAKKYNGPEDFKPGLIMPEKEEKKNKHTVLKTVVTVAALVGTAVFLKKHGKGIWNKIKGFFNKGSKVVGEGGKTAETTGRKAIEFKPGKDYIAPGTKIKVNTPAKPAEEVVRNIETSTANSSARKAVEQAIKDTPTKAQQAAYDESIRYVAPTAEQKAAIKANNAVAARETAIAHQIQNTASPESVKALEKAKQGMSEVNTSLNGLFESNGAKLTVKNGKIAKYIHYRLSHE